MARPTVVSLSEAFAAQAREVADLAAEVVRLSGEVARLEAEAAALRAAPTGLSPQRALMAQAKAFAARGIPCHIRRGQLLHAQTGEVLA